MDQHSYAMRRSYTKCIKKPNYGKTPKADHPRVKRTLTRQRWKVVPERRGAATEDLPGRTVSMKDVLAQRKVNSVGDFAKQHW